MNWIGAHPVGIFDKRLARFADLHFIFRSFPPTVQFGTGSAEGIASTWFHNQIKGAPRSGFLVPRLAPLFFDPPLPIPRQGTIPVAQRGMSP